MTLDILWRMAAANPCPSLISCESIPFLGQLPDQNVVLTVKRQLQMVRTAKHNAASIAKAGKSIMMASAWTRVLKERGRMVTIVQFVRLELN